MIQALELDGLEAEDQCNSLASVNGTAHTIDPTTRTDYPRIDTDMAASGTSITYERGDEYMKFDLNGHLSAFPPESNSYATQQPVHVAQHASNSRIQLEEVIQRPHNI